MGISIATICHYAQDGVQPLHRAVLSNHIHVVEYLVLKCGVSIESAAKVMKYVVFIFKTVKAVTMAMISFLW